MAEKTEATVPLSTDWPYGVVIYAPSNRGGYLLLATRHQTVQSRNVEIEVALTRRRRGEVGRIEVLDWRPCTRMDV